MPRKNDIRILVVDDEPDVLELVVFHLEKEAYKVAVADTGDKALKMARESLPSLLILDLMLPGSNGLEICRLLRCDPRTRDIPILMLTARAAEENRIKGLEFGAHDYVTKPFSPRELVLRIQTILRRTESTVPAELRFGSRRFDVPRKQLLEGDRPVHLTTTEASLLWSLARHVGETMSRDALLRASRIVGNARPVDVQITRLRRKIEPDPRAPRYLQTVRGEGYILVPD